jgi:hypothetical protein
VGGRAAAAACSCAGRRPPHWPCPLTAPSAPAHRRRAPRRRRPDGHAGGRGAAAEHVGRQPAAPRDVPQGCTVSAAAPLAACWRCHRVREEGLGLRIPRTARRTPPLAAGAAASTHLRPSPPVPPCPPHLPCPASRPAWISFGGFERVGGSRSGCGRPCVAASSWHGGLAAVSACPGTGPRPTHPGPGPAPAPAASSRRTGRELLR